MGSESSQPKLIPLLLTCSAGAAAVCMTYFLWHRGTIPIPYVDAIATTFFWSGGWLVGPLILLLWIGRNRIAWRLGASILTAWTVIYFAVSLSLQLAEIYGALIRFLCLCLGVLLVFTPNCFAFYAIAGNRSDVFHAILVQVLGMFGVSGVAALSQAFFLAPPTQNYFASFQPPPPLPIELGISLLLGIVMGLTTALPAWLIFRRERRNAVKNTCRACGYDLRGSLHSMNCPECGEAIVFTQT